MHGHIRVVRRKGVHIHIHVTLLPGLYYTTRINIVHLCKPSMFHNMFSRKNIRETPPHTILTENLPRCTWGALRIPLLGQIQDVIVCITLSLTHIYTRTRLRTCIMSIELNYTIAWTYIVSYTYTFPKVCTVYTHIKWTTIMNKYTLHPVRALLEHVYIVIPVFYRYMVMYKLWYEEHVSAPFHSVNTKRTGFIKN
jgi:hypothetical protein